MFDHVFACSVNNRGGREDRLRAAADSSIPLLPKHGRGTSVRSVLARVADPRRGTQPVEAATWAAEEARMGDGQHAAEGQGQGESLCLAEARCDTLRRPGRRIGQRGDATRAPTQVPRPEWAAGCRPSPSPGLAIKR